MRAAHGTISALMAAVIGAAALAEDAIVATPLEAPAPEAEITPKPAPRVAVNSAGAALLRGLDKVSGNVTDLSLAVGESRDFGRLTVALGDCRYPVDNATGEAYAYLTITAAGRSDAVFQGWMIASSPALSALDHPRYDVWVIRCTTS